MPLRSKVQCSLCLLFFAAAVFAQSPDDADAAALEASRRLDQALGGTKTAAAPVQIIRGGQEPVWINDPYAAYSRSSHVAAVGMASNRTEAEQKALAALTAIFGRQIQSEFTTVTMYSEAVSRGIVTVSDNTQIRDTVVSAASLDSLVGAEIGSVWDSGKGIVYALVYVEKNKTIAIYSEMIRMNNINIDRLTAMNTGVKNTFDGYARYKLAALISGLNVKYANVVVQSGGPQASSFNLTNTDSLNLEAASIIKNIPVTISVRGDRSNRIRDSFAKVLSGEGLRTQGSSSPYVLEVNADFSEAVFPNNNNKFCRFTVSASLIEKATGSVLLPFNISDRVGYATYEGAESSAITLIERTVSQKYPAAFREYLDTLLPPR